MFEWLEKKIIRILEKQIVDLKLIRLSQDVQNKYEQSKRTIEHTIKVWNNADNQRKSEY